MPVPIRESSSVIDLSARFKAYKTVDASPADATETVIATLTLTDFGGPSVQSRIQLRGWAAFTVGGSGVSANLRIRQTNVSGTVIAATGATTVTAANLVERTVAGFDAAPGVGVYVLTLAVGSAVAASTVSALMLEAVIV